MADVIPEAGAPSGPSATASAATTAAADTPAATAGSWLQRLTASAAWKAFAYPLALFVGSRLGILLVTSLSLQLDPRFHRPAGAITHPALQGLCWWDCGWFSSLAEKGYLQPEWTNFFPLLPLLSRGVHEVTALPFAICVVLVANAFALAGYTVLYVLFREIEGEAPARWALALFVAWPFSFFYAAGYTEPLMLFFTALAALLARRGHHLWAGAMVGVSGLGRHLSFIAGTLLVAEQVRERGPSPRRLLWSKAVLGLALPFVVTAPWFIYQYVRFGDPLMWMHARSKWGDSAWYGVWTLFSGQHFEPHIWSYFWLSLIVGAGSFALLARRRWWTLAAYGVPTILVYWAIGLMGLGRYTASCWPAFLPMGVLVARRPVLQTPALIAFAVLQGMYLYLFAHAFPIN